MPNSSFENYLMNDNKKQFSSRSFDDFRGELLQYANSFYRNQIVDFSEASLGGMLLDFAAIVGDSLVYYAEQQFNELDYETAVDPANITKHLRRVNIKNSKSSPGSTYCTFSIEVTRDTTTPDYAPLPIKTNLPTIKRGTVVSSVNGVNFTLQEDIDFTSNYVQETGEENEDGTPFSLFLSKEGLCISGNVVEETFTFANSEGAYFLSRELENKNITSIISVIDDDNNEYYEVEYLTQSTVYKKVDDADDAYITVIPSPRRFVLEDSFLTGKTTLRFGNGDGKDIKGNMFANPEDLLLPLKNKNTIGRLDLDPNSLLKNSTFGISPKGKTLTVKYKHGGGSLHNLPIGAISVVLDSPIIVFPNSDAILSSDIVTQISDSLSVTNKNSSIGGSEPLSLDELKAQIPSAIKSQSRIITSEDLIARILTMPSDFGKINKIAALDNNHSSSYKDLFVICKDSEGFYTEANDAIKTNLANYINDFRLIGYNFNILDVPVYNFGLQAKIKVKSGFDMFNVLFDINTRLAETIRFDLFQIGTPININQIGKIIEASDGVDALISDKKSLIISKSSSDEFFDPDDLTTRSYNDNVFNPQILYKDGFIYPPRGGLFEMRYTFRDIVIAAN
jgi:hypothetical protein